MKMYSVIWSFPLLSACFFCRVKCGAGGVMASAVVVGRKTQAGGSRPAVGMSLWGDEAGISEAEVCSGTADDEVVKNLDFEEL